MQHNNPGAVACQDGTIELNAGRTLVECSVTNTGDRPIQVGSHYHFLETNAALVFDRGLAYGRRTSFFGEVRMCISSGAAAASVTRIHRAVRTA